MNIHENPGNIAIIVWLIQVLFFLIFFIQLPTVVSYVIDVSTLNTTSNDTWNANVIRNNLYIPFTSIISIPFYTIGRKRMLRTRIKGSGRRRLLLLPKKITADAQTENKMKRKRRLLPIKKPHIVPPVLIRSCRLNRLIFRGNNGNVDCLMETFEIHKDATVSLNLDINISIKVSLNLYAGLTITFYSSMITQFSWSVTVISWVFRK